MIDLTEVKPYHRHIPDGVYNAQITSSLIRESKDGRGKYLQVQFTLEGHQGDAKVSMFFYVEHENEILVSRDKGKLTYLLECCEFTKKKIENLDELLTLKCSVKVENTPNIKGEIWPRIVRVMPYKKEASKKIKETINTIEQNIKETFFDLSAENISQTKETASKDSTPITKEKINPSVKKIMKETYPKIDSALTTDFTESDIPF
ncbi:MAG: hypothetical protein QW818_02560 [Candidatus Aenigmatarchaeota archaeon]